MHLMLLGVFFIHALESLVLLWTVRVVALRVGSAKSVVSEASFIPVSELVSW